MARLTPAQKRRKRRGRRRERDRRWLARRVPGEPTIVTNYRRFKKVFGESDENNPQVCGELLKFFEEGGSDVSMVRVMPEGAEVDGQEIEIE